jgi:hypothetical protein
MKLFIPLLLCIIFLNSCNNQSRKKPANFIEKEVLLYELYHDKPFCKVNLYLPVAYDTLQIWCDISDCTCCNQNKYRFTNSKNCLIKESYPFSLTNCEDSIDRLTISNQCSDYPYSQKIDKQSMDDWAESIEDHLEGIVKEVPKWRQKKILAINGNEFLLLHFYAGAVYHEKPFDQIIAYCVIKNILIKFHFECTEKENTNFTKNAFLTLNSIQLDSL